MFNIDNIARIDFTKRIGRVYSVEMVALYNITRVTENEAREAIKIEGLGENPKVIIISKKQFENVFLT